MREKLQNERETEKKKGAGSYFYNLPKGIGFITSESFHVSSKLKKKVSVIVFDCLCCSCDYCLPFFL